MKKLKLLLAGIAILTTISTMRTVAGPFGTKGKIIVLQGGGTCCKYAFFYNQCDRVPQDCGG